MWHIWSLPVAKATLPAAIFAPYRYSLALLLFVGSRGESAILVLGVTVAAGFTVQSRPAVFNLPRVTAALPQTTRGASSAGIPLGAVPLLRAEASMAQFKRLQLLSAEFMLLLLTFTRRKVCEVHRTLMFPTFLQRLMT